MAGNKSPYTKLTKGLKEYLWQGLDWRNQVHPRVVTRPAAKAAVFGTTSQHLVFTQRLTMTYLYRAGSHTSPCYDNVRLDKDVQVDQEGNVHPGKCLE